MNVEERISELERVQGEIRKTVEQDRETVA